MHQDVTSIEFTPTNSKNPNPRQYHLFYRSCGVNDSDCQIGADGRKVHYDSVLFMRLMEGVQDDRDEQLIQLSTFTTATRVKFFGSAPNALLNAILHQLTKAIASEETLFLVRCLVADEIEDQPSVFLAACGSSLHSSEDVSQFAFRLRLGSHNGGVASLIVLSNVLMLSILVHNVHNGIQRYDPFDGLATMSINVLEDPTQSNNVYGSIFPSECVNRRIVAPRRNLPDPMMVAQKVSRLELADSQMTEPSLISIDPKHGLRFASLNVNGCRNLDKRNAIDSLLMLYRVQLAVLQEVNLDCQSAITNNFHWHMSGRANNRRRGLAILIRRDLNAVHQKSIYAGSNIQHANILYQVKLYYLCITIVFYCLSG